VSHEPQRYTTGEAAKIAGLVAVMAAKGRPTPGIERQIEKVQQAAVAREQAEEAARREAKQQKINEKAARKATRKGWF
jgi:hypothetical protein